MKRILFSFILMLSCLFPTFFSTGLVYAEDTTSIVYSDVMSDLQKDEDFNIEDYPLVENDYSLHVVQIAESVNNELFVYVYQPSADTTRKATSINISTGIDENLSYMNYGLIYLNSNQTLFKYKVNNLTLMEEETRYYDITGIYREFDETIDEGLSDDNENTIDEVVYRVAKVWSVRDFEGQTLYTCLDTEVVEITDKYVGYVRYTGGFELFGWSDACDSHFVAFSTDRQIDKLIDADVYYTSQGCFSYVQLDPVHLFDTVYGDVEEHKAELTHTQKSSFTGDGWFANTYTWNRISTVEDFIENENTENFYMLGSFNVTTETKLTAEGRADLEGKQWVLRFAETAFKEEGTSTFHSTERTIIGDVSILRLEFETNGEVYNLGVIDNKQTGSDTPDNTTNVGVEPNSVWRWFERLAEWLANLFGWDKNTIFWILAVLFVIGITLVLLAIFAPNIFIGIFKFIWQVIVWIFKGLWWLIKTPLELFK